MKKQRILQSIFLSALLALLLHIIPLWAENNANYSLTNGVISNGGGTINAGKYRLSATIGQQTAGNISGGDYTINAGFWANIDGTGRTNIYLPLVQR